MQYLSQVLSTEDKESLFKINGLKLCVAPTGSGKTYLIVEEMKNEYQAMKAPFGMKRVLLLVNRSALLEQYLKAIDETFMQTFEKDGYYVYRNSVHVYSYQAAQRRIDNYEEFLKAFDLIIMDEAHYFLQDSWNGKTDDVFTRIIERSKDIPCTMFTATPEELQDYVKVRKIDMKPIDYSDKLGFNERIKCIATNKDFHDIINGIPLTEKYILFVNNSYTKNKIANLADELTTDSRCVGFYHSKWDNRHGYFKIIKEMKDKYQNLVELHKFDEDGAVANAAVDNGVDFKDEDLKHIILLDHYDPVTMKQMIGRKRFNINNAEDKLKVWVVNTDRKFLQREKEQALEQVMMYDAYKNLSAGAFIEEYAERLKYAELVTSLNNETAEKLKDDIEKYETDKNVSCIKVKMCHAGENVFTAILTVNFCLVSKSYYRLNYLNRLLDTKVQFNENKVQNMALHKVMEHVLSDMGYLNVSIDHKNTYYEHLVKKQEIAENIEYKLIPFIEIHLGKLMNKVTFDEFRSCMYESFGVKDARGKKPGVKIISQFLESNGYMLSKNRKTTNGKQETLYSISK
ncbi:DEAD/DEAH box helicase [Priestia sp. RMT2NF4]|uniref:DEAD/DEAH box helicase n=1 Tax=Priestia sp. RMT2NF4 TaxID=3398394 RepID=UPI003A4C7401